MSDWIDGLCVFSPEQCQLLKDNIDLYVSIAVITVLMHAIVMTIPDFIGKLIVFFMKRRKKKKESE